MNLYSPILRLFGLGGLSNPDQGPQHAAIHSKHSESGITVTDSMALRISAVWRCVDIIANSVASLPLHVYTQGPNGREQLARHPLLDLFIKSPNAHMKPRDVRVAMTTQLALYHNAYAAITWNESGTRPLSVMPLRVGRMVPVITDGVLTYHYHVEGGVIVYDKRSILHLKGFSTDGIAGYERLAYAKDTTGLTLSAEIYAAKQFANGGNSAGGYLMFDDWLTENQREQARKLYAGISETAYNANKLWILEGGVKYTANTLPPDTMQMLQTRQMQVSEIARFFGVPAVLLDAGANSSSAWPASFEQQMLSFLTFTLQSYLDEWECALLDAFVPFAERQKIAIDHDVSQFIRMDSTARANYLSSLVQNGLMTRDEGRARLGMAGTGDVNADKLTVQVNLTPLGRLGENATQTTQPPDPMQS